MHVHDRAKNSSGVTEVISLLDGNQTPELEIWKLMISKKISKVKSGAQNRLRIFMCNRLKA